MKNKIMITALTTILLAVSAQTVSVYAQNNEILSTSSNVEESEEDNFVYDILDEMLKETDSDIIETESNHSNWSFLDLFGVDLLWGNKEDEEHLGHYSSSGAAGKKANLNKATIEKLRIAATMPDKFTQEPEKNLCKSL